MLHRVLARKRIACALVLICAAAAWAGTAALDPARYVNDVRYLASPELGGRGTGTPGMEKAAQYIAAQFRSAGLKPLASGDYLQAFNVTTNATLGPGNRFAWTGAGVTHTLKFQDEFIPFNFSSKAPLAGALVFVGYGITAPEYNYDDYAGVDVKGKIAVLLRHEPQEFDEKSVFAGKVYTEHAQFFSKASNAKMHGARGVILVMDRGNHPGSEDALESFSRSVGPADAGIPFSQVKTAVAEQWFALAGRKLEDIQKAIDKDLRPQSFAFPDSLQVDARLDLERAVKTVHNVAAYLPGETGEYVVIGAHYDHLGLGEQFSLAPSQTGTVHPGADDNASGTAGVIELARWFAARPKPKRGVLFLAFAGEELGLLGSSYYVNHPDLPMGQAVAMINMDMIGRMRDGKVFVGGTGSGTTLKALLEEVAARHPGLKLDYSDVGGYGSSDHTSFTTKQVPVLFFFSGLHGDYHKPSDTWDKIDGPGTVRLLTLISDVAARLAEAPGRPGFVKVAPPPSMGGGGPGYGAYFGSVPDFGEGAKGVKFADVREGSPAAKAGLKGGDILVEFDGKPIQNLYDFTYVLRTKKPGDEVAVKVLRDGKPLEAKVTLTKRN
ncbi:MAG: M28 family peptidase [Bryobacteraceae bacterium]